MIAMILVYYLVFFDPELDPFVSTSRQAHIEGSETIYKPNPIDKMLLSFIRRCSGKLIIRLRCFRDNTRPSRLSRLQRSMTRVRLRISIVLLPLIDLTDLLLSRSAS